MANFNLYAHTKAVANEYVKQFAAQRLAIRVIERGSMNNRAGSARYQIVVINPGIDDREFEQKCLQILG